jgi:hypothetical protein
MLTLIVKLNAALPLKRTSGSISILVLGMPGMKKKHGKV